MYGFQPKSARGKAVQQLADGGMVHSIKGMLGLRPKTREELLAADAKAQARNQEAAGRVAERSAQQPAPATPAPQAAISDYSGMNAIQRREKEQGLKNGGMVKPRGFKAGGMIQGPGTGTSDSIETEKKPGTFIMPADSTKAIGPEVLEELGEPMEAAEEAEGMEFESAENEGPEEEGDGEAVPVRLSNGEFEFTPQQVQSLGEAVLTVFRDATHEQSEGGKRAIPKAAGFAPRQFFADGGMIENDVTRIGNSYSGGNVGGDVSINGQAGAGTMSTVPAPVAAQPQPAPTTATPAATPAATPGATPATPATPAAPAAAPMGWAERNALRSTQVTASSIMDSPERRAAQAKLSPTPAPVASVAPTTPAVGGIQSATTAMDATKPKPFGAQTTSPFGFKPRGYADGGMVKPKKGFDMEAWTQQQEQQRAAGTQAALAAGKAAMDEAEAQASARQGQQSPVGMTPGQASRAGLITSPTPIGNTAAPSEPAAPATANVTQGAAFGVFNRPETAGNRGGMMLPYAATGPKTFEPAKSVYGAETRMSASTDPRSLTFGGSSVAAGAPYIGVGFNPDPSKAAATPDAAAKAPTAPPQPPAEAPSAAGLSPSSQGDGMGPPNLSRLNQSAAAAPAADPNAVTSNVVKNGNSYSGANVAGDITINGQAPRAGGQISEQNVAAADALASRQQQDSVGRVAGFQPTGITAPTVRNSTNDWAARKQLENMATAASSITNRPEWQSGSTTIAGSTRGPNGAGDPEGKVAAYKAALANDLALQQAQPNMEQAAMRENGANQRATLQDAGATARTVIQDQGATTREAGRTALTAEELGLRREAAGFQTRAAKRRESAYDNYSKAKTDEDRQAIAKQFPDLFGQAKDAAHRMEVVRGKTDPMTGQSSGDYVVVQDPKTGEVRQIQMGAASAAPTQALPKAGEVRNGFRFKGGNPNDQANWAKV